MSYLSKLIEKVNIYLTYRKAYNAEERRILDASFKKDLIAIAEKL